MTDQCNCAPCICGPSCQCGAIKQAMPPCTCGCKDGAVCTCPAPANR
jgi:hypothetical protein